MTWVRVFAGTFESQPLTFAHLMDVAVLDLDHVDVICRVDPSARLRHVLAEPDAQTVEDALGDETTVVLVFAQGGRFEGSERLRLIGDFPSHRPIAN